MLQIRFLQQQQIEAIRNNSSYQSVIHLNHDSIQELQWWFNNLEICNGRLIVSPTSKKVIQSDASKKGWWRIIRKCQQVVSGLSRSQNSISISGSVSHQTSFFNFPENVRSQINPFPSRKYECPFVTDENGRGGKSTQNKGMIAISKEIWEFALSKGIMITAEYLPGRLGFQKFPRLKRMATISKSIPRNLCKVRIPRAGSLFASGACHQIPSYLSWKADPHSLATDACFSSFFNDRKSSIQGQNRGGGCG